MFLSIIVPVYNVEKYIRRCIDSLLNQNIDNYEIIVVNDGSADKTDEIITKEYIDKIRYLKKDKNSGLSDTRNYGIKIAKGDYVIFVDSDDYIEENCLSKINDYIMNYKEVDVIFTDYYVNKNDYSYAVKGYVAESNTIWNSRNFLTYELGKRSLPVPACFAIYKRKFLVEKKMSFLSGVLHEDELWTITILLNAERIATSSLCYYHYVIRAGSIMQKKDKTQNGIDMILICNKLIKMLNEIDDKKLKKMFENHISMLYMKAMCIGKLYRKEYRNQFKRCLPLKYAHLFKDKVKACLFALSPCIYYIFDIKYGVKL